MKGLISVIMTAVILTVFSVSAFAHDGDGYGRKHYRHRRNPAVRAVRSVERHLPVVTVSTRSHHRRGRGHNRGATTTNAPGASGYAPGTMMRNQSGPGMNAPGAVTNAPAAPGLPMQGR
ncbi:hypothetical protein [Candidatus Magnetominusculus dajiuhuensis]|uniref:hypothetical protein n=1 Tax=Candidatus Magnetominusculus dajiuhuensis TaxID=3137712 RepID=UPI003B439691